MTTVTSGGVGRPGGPVKACDRHRSTYSATLSPESPGPCYLAPVFGLSFGEVFLVAFIFLAVVLAPYSGSVATKVYHWLKPMR